MSVRELGHLSLHRGAVSARTGTGPVVYSERNSFSTCQKESLINSLKELQRDDAMGGWAEQLKNNGLMD